MMPQDPREKVWTGWRPAIQDHRGNFYQYIGGKIMAKLKPKVETTPKA